jgi:hypothetical protein
MKTIDYEVKLKDGDNADVTPRYKEYKTSILILLGLESK